MKKIIRTPEDLGLLIRAVRKDALIRQDDLAGLAKVSKQFAADVERGKPTMQFGKVLLLLRQLGIQLFVDLPDEIEPLIETLATQRNAARIDGRSNRKRSARSALASSTEGDDSSTDS